MNIPKKCTSYLNEGFWHHECRLSFNHIGNHECKWIHCTGYGRFYWNYDEKGKLQTGRRLSKAEIEEQGGL